MNHVCIVSVTVWKLNGITLDSDKLILIYEWYLKANVLQHTLLIESNLGLVFLDKFDSINQLITLSVIP